MNYVCVCVCVMMMIGVGVDLINECQISRGTLDKHTESRQLIICYDEQKLVENMVKKNHNRFSLRFFGPP